MLDQLWNIAELLHCFDILTFTLSKISCTNEFGCLFKDIPLLTSICTQKSLPILAKKNGKLDLLFL